MNGGLPGVVVQPAARFVLLGGGTWSMIKSNRACRSLHGLSKFYIGPSLPDRGIHGQEIQLVVIGVGCGKQVKALVHGVVRFRTRLVDHVQNDNEGQPQINAFDAANSVWGSRPSAAFSNRIAPSTMPRIRSTSPPKSARTGVSTTLMRVPFPLTGVTLFRMVIPLCSRFRSLLSIAQATTNPGFRERCRAVSTAHQPAWFCLGRRER